MVIVTDATIRGMQYIKQEVIEILQVVPDWIEQGALFLISIWGIIAIAKVIRSVKFVG